MSSGQLGHASKRGLVGHPLENLLLFPKQTASRSGQALDAMSPHSPSARAGSRVVRISKANGVAERIASNGDGGIAGLNVLIAEDDVLTAADLVAAFEDMGVCIVGPASTVRDALELVEQAERLDGAVIDIELRGGTAYPIAEALVKRGTPFVFATGYSQTAIHAFFSNIVACEKPASPEQIARALFGDSRINAVRLKV
jgi:CheY-like chemotaxis protein